MDFGIFSSPLQVNVDEGELLSLEERLDYRFEISLIYSQLHMPFPMAAMEKAAELGKTVELTIQVSAQNNEDIFGYTPMFDLADGRLDGQIRALAQNIKAFGRPLLFRGILSAALSIWASSSMRSATTPVGARCSSRKIPRKSSCLSFPPTRN